MLVESSNVEDCLVLYHLMRGSGESDAGWFPVFPEAANICKL